MNFYSNIFKKNHPFQLVKPSLLPIMLSYCVFFFVYFIIQYLHGYQSQLMLLGIKLYGCSIFAQINLWFYLMRFESRQLFIYTKEVENNILTAMILFIVSEIFLFVSFFWAFFNSSLNPSIFIGAVWPPVGIESISPWNVPLLNTLILLTSGITVNCYYYSLKVLSFCPRSFILFTKSFVISHKVSVYNSMRYWKLLYVYLLITIFLGLFFLIVQLFEYINSTFSITDGIYGSVFYMLTGLHGCHVLLGLILLVDSFIRTSLGDFDINPNIHVSSTCTVWYWHFVDVVWLFLFIFVYVWGS